MLAVVVVLLVLGLVVALVVVAVSARHLGRFRDARGRCRGRDARGGPRARCPGGHGRRHRLRRRRHLGREAWAPRRRRAGASRRCRRRSGGRGARFPGHPRERRAPAELRWRRSAVEPHSGRGRVSGLRCLAARRSPAEARRRRRPHPFRPEEPGSRPGYGTDREALARPKRTRPPPVRRAGRSRVRLCAKNDSPQISHRRASA